MKYIIVGTGAVGLSLMDELVKRGNEILLVNRSIPSHTNFPRNVSFLQHNAINAEALAELCRGADFLVQAAGSKSEHSATELPLLIDALIGAARISKARLVCIDSMGAYGDNLGIPMSEATPERPSCPDEALRADLSGIVMQAHKSGAIQAVIARAGTLYGPRVLNSPLGSTVFTPLVAGKIVHMVGRLDMPHAFTYIKDLARAVANLCENDESWGHIWHVPCPQPITQQQVLDILRDMVSRTISADTINSSFLGLKTLFNPALKQYKDILYRFEKPYVINHSRFTTTFGERTTPHTQALYETLDWYKQRAGITRRYGI